MSGHRRAHSPWRGASVAVASPLERYEREYLPLVHLIEDFESAS